ncbi:MAG TPA: hypothetical protein VJM31_02425 [Vicinamibacterales bacterium]|nr:hypothetical protein [Vicinamibacterales bacterium]
MSAGKGDRLDMRAIFSSMTTGAAAVALLAGSISCGDVARQGRSPAMLIVDSLQGASGAAPGTFSTFLLSDVQTIVESQPTFFNDVGQASLRLVLKDQGAGSASPSTLNAVNLNRYHVVFRRADGRNTPGVDVPFPVDGGVTRTIAGNDVVAVSFEIVRHQAKLEQPLRSLANFGGRLFITTIAEVTFYGSDLAGNAVQATGTMNVSFGDYADPE